MRGFVRQWVESIKKTNGRTLENMAKEQKHLQKFQNPWPTYELDARQYTLGFISKDLPQIRQLSQRFAERHKRGESVLVVDICGIANASSLGADHTIGFTFKKTPKMESTESMTIVDGDIFTSQGQGKLISAIDARHTPISCFFFRPMAGMHKYGENPHTFARLYVLLRKLFERLADNAEAYIA